MAPAANFIVFESFQVGSKYGDSKFYQERRDSGSKAGIRVRKCRARKMFCIEFFVVKCIKFFRCKRGVTIFDRNF